MPSGSALRSVPLNAPVSPTIALVIWTRSASATLSPLKISTVISRLSHGAVPAVPAKAGGFALDVARRGAQRDHRRDGLRRRSGEGEQQHGERDRHRPATAGKLEHVALRLEDG